MKKIVIALLLIVVSAAAFSQTITDRIYVKGDWREIMNTIYLYPNFKPGMILFKNGQRFYKPINFNRFISTIEYLEKNDTLLLADESAINAIIVDSDVFLFTPACVRTIYNGKVKLFKYEKSKMGDIQKTGAFGVPNSTTSMQTIDKIDSYQRSFPLDIQESVIVSRAITYLIETPDHQYVPASKKNFLKANSRNESQIKAYIDEHKINFNKENDLLQLVKFTESL